MSSDDLRHLRHAAESGDLETVHRLVEEEGVDVNSLLSTGKMRGLHIASMHGHAEVVQFLLDNKADVNARNGCGSTALHLACIPHANIRVIEFLIDHKADINASDKYGRTALCIALNMKADSVIIRFLLENNADPNAVDEEGGTTLYHTLRCNYGLEVVQCLLECGADVTARRKYCGSTALHCALQCGSDIEVVRLLIDSGACVNATDNGSNAPFHIISPYHGITAPVMELLLSHGADAHAKNQFLQTPLHCMASHDCVDVATVLLDHLRSNAGQDMVQSALLAVDQAKCMPFHYVWSVEMAKLLLEQPLTADDQLVPRACPLMLFTEDGRGRSLLDSLRRSGPLKDYLVSYTDLPLTVPAAATNDVAVKFNPMLNDFQSSIAEAFLHKWDGWSTLFVQNEDNGTEDAKEDDYYLLPVELKLAVMANLSTADVMMLRATS